MEDTTESNAPAADEQLFVDAAELGKDTAIFEIFGNEVQLHTLTIKETLEASRVAKAYRDTQAEWLALKTAIVACAIDDINGVEFYRPISVDEPTAQRRFKKLSDNYYSDFIAECYTRYTELEDRQKSILDKLKKATA